MAACRYCYREIFFAYHKAADGTRSKKATPISGTPSATGNLRVSRRRTSYEILSADEAIVAREEGEFLYRVHFADCDGRKKKKK